MARNEGGPVFPGGDGECAGNPQYYSPGMSYRRWLAGQALVGEVASLSTPEAADAVSRNMMSGETVEDHIARTCWRLADSIIRTENAVLGYCDDCAGTGGNETGEPCGSCCGTGRAVPNDAVILDRVRMMLADTNIDPRRPDYCADVRVEHLHELQSLLAAHQQNGEAGHG